MAITKRTNTKNYYSEFTINGKKHIKSTGTTNKALASKIDIKYYQDAIENSKLSGQSISLKDALVTYKESLRSNPDRQKAMGYTIGWIEKNMDATLPMSKIDTAFVHKFVDMRFALGHKPGSVRHDMLIFSGTIKLMKKLGYDVCTVEMPSVKVKNEKDRILTADEEAKLLKELLPIKGIGAGPRKLGQQQDLHDLVVILLELGCRWGEATAIKWDQLDFDNKVITIWRDKTSSAAVLPMSTRVYNILSNRTVRCAWVFPNLKLDGPKCYNAEPFKAACARAGIAGVTFHSCRHGRITKLCKAGMSLQQIQQISGHSTIESLMRYSHLTSGDVIDKAREILEAE